MPQLDQDKSYALPGLMAGDRRVIETVFLGDQLGLFKMKRDGENLAAWRMVARIGTHAYDMRDRVSGRSASGHLENQSTTAMIRATRSSP